MLIIAHRGARASHPENTLSAIQAAIDSGCKAIEIDVHEHDNEFWVIHDKWLNRTTNGVGLLSGYNKEKLQALDAGNGEVIPTLKQVIELIAGQCAVNVELKGIKNFSLLLAHIEYAVEKCGFMNQQLLFSSFNHCWLNQLHQHNPSLIIGALTSSQGLDKAAFAQQLQATSINIDIDVIDKDYVTDAKNRGLKVYVFTANRPEEWHWLESLGVDGVFCDCPAQAIAVYEQPEKVSWAELSELPQEVSLSYSSIVSSIKASLQPR